MGAVTPGPARSRFRTRATSASTTTWTKRPMATSARSAYTPEPRRNALTGSGHWNISWAALPVKPAFQPITRSPRETRASRTRSWTA